QEKLDLLAKLRKLTLPKKVRNKYGLDSTWTLARINWNNPEQIIEHPDVIKKARRLLSRRGIVIPSTLEIDQHDRVNGCIKHRVIEMFADEPRGHGKLKGTMIFRVTVDEAIAPQSLVTGLDWWHDAFHTAAKAAKYLGFRFRIVFNERT